MLTSPRASNRRYLPTSPFKPPPESPPAEQYELDDLVTHDKDSLGRVVLVESGVVVVDFSTRKMRLVAPFAPMTKL